MELIIRHQQEVVDNCLLLFDNAIDENNREEADKCLKHWLRESARLDLLEDINIGRI
jgi:hypothetical protein